MTTEPTLDDLLNAPTEISTGDGSTYELTADFWIDSMPPIPDTGAPLVGRLILNDTTEFSLPVVVGPLQATDLYLVKDGNIYTLDFGIDWGQKSQANPNEYFVNFSTTVDFGSSIDVVLRLTQDGTEYLLKAENQPVTQTC